ncbi:MAG: molybdopterin cofactor-binding domain-containing protein [Hyphomicrobiaceae bacterium]
MDDVPNGTHVVEIEIDRDTGHLTLDRAIRQVDDYGVQVNPMIVAGQVHGAIAWAYRAGDAGEPA